MYADKFFTKEIFNHQSQLDYRQLAEKEKID